MGSIRSSYKVLSFILYPWVHYIHKHKSPLRAWTQHISKSKDNAPLATTSSVLLQIWLAFYLVSSESSCSSLAQLILINGGTNQILLLSWRGANEHSWKFHPHLCSGFITKEISIEGIVRMGLTTGERLGWKLKQYCVFMVAHFNENNCEIKAIHFLACRLRGSCK